MKELFLTKEDKIHGIICGSLLLIMTAGAVIMKIFEIV